MLSTRFRKSFASAAKFLAAACICLGGIVTSPLFCQSPGPPKYSEESIVHGATFLSGEFAPNSFISIFGEDLAWSTRTVASANLDGNTLPTSLGGVQVLVGPTKAFLVFVSPGQINALLDSRLLPGNYELRVLRDSWAGPAAKIKIAETSPGLFAVADGFPVVTRPDGSLVTEQDPARPGQIVILWATGLGPTDPASKPGELPRGAATLRGIATFQITLDGIPVPSANVLYAGVAPGFAGLFQINLLLPDSTPQNPRIQVGFPNSLSAVNQTIFVTP